MSVLSGILRGLSAVGRLVGRTMNEWSEWAAANPQAAALQLGVIAARADARADAMRNQHGYRARRNRALANRLRAQALAILANHPKACKVEPGTWREKPPVSQ